MGVYYLLYSWYILLYNNKVNINFKLNYELCAKQCLINDLFLTGIFSTSCHIESTSELLASMNWMGADERKLLTFILTEDAFIKNTFFF